MATLKKNLLNHAFIMKLLI